MHVLGDVFFGRCLDHHLVALAERKVVIERTAIGSNRIGCQAEVRLNLQP